MPDATQDKSIDTTQPAPVAQPTALDAFNAWFDAYCTNSPISQNTETYNRIYAGAEVIRRELSGAM